MEILNRNQRRSAVIRMVSLMIFIFAMTIVVLYAMHENYSQFGNEDYLRLEKEYNEARQNWEAKENDLQTRRVDVVEKLKKCQESKKNPNQEIVILQQRIQAHEDEIDRLDRDLTRCRNDLNQFIN